MRRDIPDTTTAAWNDGVFVGERRPIARATVQHPKMALRNYSLLSTFTETVKVNTKTLETTVTIDPARGHKVHQSYADFLFTPVDAPKEIPNIKTLSWTRSIDQDFATATLELLNTRPLEIGETPSAGDLDLPGYYTYDRGGASFRNRWGHEQNEWFGLLMPDNIVRTYEGYGWTPGTIPENDPLLSQTGLWIIDSVAMSATGTMTLAMRDIGSILEHQMFYKPVVPDDFYDQGFEPWPESVTTKTSSTGKLKVKAQDSSNTPWIGSGTVQGHTLASAFDGDPNTYWLSIGNDRPSRRFAYEWVQCSVNSQSVSRVRFRAKKKNYTYYISVMTGGSWQGSHSINYHEDGIGMNGADIAYVATGNVSTEGFIDVTLPHTYAKATKVRLTFGNLQDFHIGTYHYRAGIRDVEVYGATTKTSTTSNKQGAAGSNPGRYRDYTDIVKLLCAWGGFYWPLLGKQRKSDGSFYYKEPPRPDHLALGKVPGRVYGSFQLTGTTGPVALDASNFDKKSLMDCISYIREQIGFIWFIDEVGAVQWRLPNVYNYGCLETSLSSHPKYNTGFTHVIDERSVLMTLDCTIESSNVREGYFVGDSNGKIGSYAAGFNPNPTGLRRVAGWTDVGFAPAADINGKSTKAEVQAAYNATQLMADMLSLRQLFVYRKDRVRIPAHPAIQIDDQVRINERTTAEGYVHYVRGISSSLDMESGQWTYDLDTHWLGYDPSTKWLFGRDQLSEVSRDYIEGQLKTVNIQDV